MSEANAMLDEITRQINSVDAKDLYAINSVMKPTETMITMIEVCCHMFNLKPKKANQGKVQGDTKGYFDLAKKSFLNNPHQFMQMMVEYSKDNQKDSTVNKVNAILNTPGFTAEKVKRSSAALEGIYKWA
jgi:hypothetical protein